MVPAGPFSVPSNTCPQNIERPRNDIAVMHEASFALSQFGKRQRRRKLGHQHETFFPDQKDGIETAHGFGGLTNGKQRRDDAGAQPIQQVALQDDHQLTIGHLEQVELRDHHFRICDVRATA